MNIHILPNWCKKLGIFLVLTYFILGGFEDFINGFNDGYYATPESGINYLSEFGYFSFREYFGERINKLLSILYLVGMLIYMLSKEKVEDDYIDKLRLQSFQLSFIIVISTMLVSYIFNSASQISVETILGILLTIYLITFAIKKRIV